MFMGYSDNHKAYRLIDVDTNRLIFDRDVVFDEEVGIFELSSLVFSLGDQPLKAKDLGVRLPLAPTEGSDFDDYELEDV